MSANSDDLMWAFVEEAVIRDRGCNEEQCLNDIVRSYLCRRGMADTLEAFDDELREREVPALMSASLQAEEVSTAASARSEESRCILARVKARKRAQMLCLTGRYEEAAAMVPATSPLRVKLLSLEALRQVDPLAGIAYASTKIAPLIPFCDDTMMAHDMYIDTVSSLLEGRSEELLATLTQDATGIAYDVNEELLDTRMPSALNILISWSEWQQTSSVVDS